MFTKVCPTCCQKSFSSCSTFEWNCPVCSTDLTGQYAGLVEVIDVKKRFPVSRQLKIVIKSSIINQQI
ncbi:hypothetical protein FIU87_18080 [Bacillus sp. THAF10]|nr:hypothetical protein FIU87_18080 [Bacillus sp. THAF10]